jgi:tetratricopeptide (TPR) repeat protein
VRSGEEALSRADLDAAEASLSRAREAADQMRSEGETPDAETALRLDLLWGSLRARLGKPEEARALLRTVATEAARVGREDMRADALLEIANCRLSLGDLENALETADESVAVAEAAGDRARALTARIFAGSVLRRLGRMGDAGERFDRVFADLEETDPPSLRSLASQSLAWIRAQHGAFREAEDLAGMALELARAARDPIAEQQALSTLAFVRVEMGDAEKALELHEASLCLSRSLAIRRREGIDLANVGEAHYLLGRWEEALERFDEALGIFVEIGDRACEGDCRVNMGRTLLASGRVDEALATLERGIATCAQTGRREYEGIGHYYVGDARLDRGELAEARAAFERSRDIFVDLGWHDVWRIEHALARVALAQGDREGARAHVAEALARVEQARANLPPTGDYARFSEQVAALMELGATLGE